MNKLYKTVSKFWAEELEIISKISKNDKKVNFYYILENLSGNHDLSL